MFKTILFLYLFYTITWAFELTILHTNDIHSRFEMFNGRGAACKVNDTCYGGVVRRGSYVKQVRREDSNVLLLDAGDQFQGTPWFFTYKGTAAAFFLNKLNYTAMALGNHEFDNGVDGLRPFLHNVSIPILCSNLIIDDKVPDFLKENVKDHIVVEVGGRKIGIIGYLTNEVTTLSRTENLTFEDELHSIRRVAQNLTRQGINIIIAVGHSGLKKDKEMAANIPEVDVFVGGHSHSFLYTGDPPTKELLAGVYPIEIERGSYSKGLVVQSGSFGKYIGTLKVSFDENGNISCWSGNPVLMNSSIPHDKDLQEDLDRLNEKVKVLYIKIMGSSGMIFDTENNICRVKECEMGNMYADAMMDYMEVNPNWKADLAIVNSGSFRASLDEGNVTFGEAITVFPFSHDIILVNLLGSNLRKVFEQSVKDFSLESKHGKFLQVSRVFVKYNLTQPNDQRVVELKVYNKTNNQYEDVNDDREYSILVPSFLYNGGDGYAILKNGTELAIDVLDVDIFFAYLKKCSPIAAKLEGRINGMTTFPGWNKTYTEVPWNSSKQHTYNSSCRYRSPFVSINSTTSCDVSSI